MLLKTIIFTLIVLAIAGGIIFYLIRAKRRGETCIGCPYAKQCGKCSGGCAGHDSSCAGSCNTSNTSGSCPGSGK